ncbi:MAG: HEAT repeat domain-containing protein [Fimbriimonadaceae bacterium]|nr:HEAT repeat domain-containing protein [Fimbriimonadaceae bacterium]
MRCRRWWLLFGLLAGWPGLGQAPDVPVLAKQAYGRAAKAKAAGKLPAAEAHLVQALKLHPRYADAWWMIGWVRQKSGHATGAATAFRQAAAWLPKQDPRLAESLRQAARLEAQAQRAVKPITALAVEPVVGPFSTEFLHGWPLALLGSLALVCAVAAALAARQDHQAGLGSWPARFALACGAAARGDLGAVTRLLRWLEQPELAGIAASDFALPLRAAAEAVPAVRQRLAETVAQAAGRRREAAAGALAELTDQPAPEAWTPLLSDEQPALRALALRGLAHQPDPAAAVTIEALASGDELDEAIAATRVLPALDDALAVPALLRLLTGAARPEVRGLAAELLAARRQVPPEQAAPLTALVADCAQPHRLALLRALAKAGPVGRQALLPLLLDDDKAVRQLAQELLLSGPAEDPAGLLAALPAPGQTVRREALEVVARWAPEAALPYLAAALGSPAASRRLRLMALQHLVAHRGEAVDQALAAGLAACGAAADEATDDLLAGLAAALAERDVTAALPDLLARPEAVCRVAAQRLAALPAAAEGIVTAAQDSRPAVRQAAFELLAEHPAPEAAEVLLAELSRQDLATLPLAVRALGRLPEGRALEALQALRRLEQPAELGDRLDVALARLGDAAALARVEAMLIREAWPDRRPAADYFADQAAIPPRARQVVEEAAAHTAATRWRGESSGRVAALVALGPAVLPTLAQWQQADDPALVADAAAARQALRRRKA